MWESGFRLIARMRGVFEGYLLCVDNQTIPGLWGIYFPISLGVLVFFASGIGPGNFPYGFDVYPDTPV